MADCTANSILIAKSLAIVKSWLGIVRHYSKAHAVNRGFVRFYSWLARVVAQRWRLLFDSRCKTKSVSWLFSATREAQPTHILVYAVGFLEPSLHFDAGSVS